MIINIYAMITIIFATVAALILIFFLVKNKVNFEFSKDKLSVNTSQGKFISSDKIKSIIIEIEKISDIIFRIKTIDIIQEQMKYLERQTITFYRALFSTLDNDSKKINKKNFDLHRYQMLDVFRDDVLKKNHFLTKTDWEGYKKQMFQYCFDRSCELFGEIEDYQVYSDNQMQELRMLFGEYFFGWMDTFRAITQEKIKEINNLQSVKDELYKELGFQFSGGSSVVFSKL